MSMTIGCAWALQVSGVAIYMLVSCGLTQPTCLCELCSFLLPLLGTLSHQPRPALYMSQMMPVELGTTWTG